MQTVELTDVYKASAEVASLGSSDCVLVADSNGVQKRVSRSNFLEQDSMRYITYSENRPGWYSVVEIYTDSSSGGILMLTPGLWGGSPRMEMFAVCGRCYNGVVQRPAINNLSGTTPMIKMRAVRFDNRVRIDAYTSYSTRKFQVNAIGIFSMITPSINPSTDGALDIWEYDFTTSVFGGGKRLFINKLRNLAERRVA